jgi:hypothetical protein
MEMDRRPGLKKIEPPDPAGGKAGTLPGKYEQNFICTMGVRHKVY